MPLRPQVWKKGDQSMYSRRVARGKLSRTRTPVKAGVGMSSARHSMGVRRARAVSRGTTCLAGRGVGFAEGFVVGAMLGDEVCLAVVAEEAGGDGHGAAGVEHVDDGLAVVRRDLDGGVGAAGGGSADEQRQLEALALHLVGDVDHLVERGGDEAAEADHVGLLGLGALEDFFAGDHDAEVDDLVVVAGEDDADDVLADVVDVAFDGGEEDLALGLDDFAGGCHRGLFGFHEGREVGYGLLHDAGGFDDLREEHLAGSEEVADYAHAVHERAFDDEERAAELDAGFFGVDLDVGVDALHERVGETLFDGAVAPLFGLLFARLTAPACLSVSP